MPSEDSKPLISILIPTLNEGKNIGAVLTSIVSQEDSKEIVVIDGGSRDRTVDVCLQYTDKVYRQLGKGKGNAIKEGVEKCDGEYVLIIDGDGSHNPDEIPMLKSALLDGADIVRGSRFMRSGNTYDMEPWRKFGNYLFVVLTNILFSARFSDLCYGYLGFKRDVFTKLKVRENGFAIDAEIIVKAKKHGFKIVEVPSVELKRTSGKSRLRAVPDGLRILNVILREVFSR